MTVLQTTGHLSVSSRVFAAWEFKKNKVKTEARVPALGELAVSEASTQKT